MEDNKDLEEFGFEPIEEQEDLSEFGFEPIDSVESDRKSSISDDAQSVAAGALVGKGLQKAGESVAEKGPEFAERLAYRAIGGFDTPEGQKFVRNQIERLGLPETDINYNTIGREILDRDYLGKTGLRKSLNILKDIDTDLVESIENKKGMLGGLEGSIDLRKVLSDTNKELSEIDPYLSIRNKQVYDLLDKEKELFSQRPSSSISPLEAEAEKANIQRALKYDTTKADSASDIYDKAKATSLRKNVEDLAKMSGLGKDFAENKKLTGKLQSARGIIAGKTLDEFKTPRPGLGDVGGVVTQNPAIPLITRAINKGSGPLAKATDALSKLAGSKVGRGALRSLPFAGAMLGYQSARAAGMEPGEALGEAISEEVTAPIGGIEGVGKLPKGSLYERVVDPSLSMDERREAYEKLQEQSPFQKQQAANQSQKQALEQAKQQQAVQMSNTMKSSEDPGVQSMGNQLENALNNNDDLEKTLWSMRQQPAFREVLKRQGIETPEAMVDDSTEQENPVNIEDLKSTLDSYSKMVASGDETPEYEIDQAMGQIDDLGLPENEAQELKDRLITADTPSKVEELKALLESLQELN